MNFIKKFFSVLKIWLKCHYDEVNSDLEEFDEYLECEVMKCLKSDTVKTHFEHAKIHT